MKSIIRIVLLLVIFTSTATFAQTSSDTIKIKSKKVDVASVASFLTSAFKKQPKKEKKSDNPNPILAAIEDDDIPRFKEVIASGIDINATYDGETALSILCLMTGDSETRSKMIEILLNTPGIKVNVSDKKLKTSPFQSLYGINNYDNIVKLIKLGSDVNRTAGHFGGMGGTPLWLASHWQFQFEGSKSKTLAILRNAGSELDVNYVGAYDVTAGRSCVKNEYPEAVEILLKRGAYVEDTEQGDVKVGLIFETIGHNKHDVLDILMKYGANKYGPTSSSKPPLNYGMIPEGADWAEYFITTYNVDVNYLGKPVTPADVPAILEASMINSVEGLEVLFRHGAKVDLGNSSDYTGLEGAAGANSLDAAKYLIDKGADVNHQDRIGMSPIIHATVMFHYDMIKLLLKEGADINLVHKGVPWGSPLAYLAMKFIPSERKKVAKAIKKIIELGADPNQLLTADGTALMMAAKLGTKIGYKGALSNSTVLIEAGADVNLQNTSGETALMIASGSGNKKLVELLIESGADLNLKSSLNETALNYAEVAQFNKDDIIQSLKEAGAIEGTATTTAVSSASASTSDSKSTSSASVPGDLFGTWRGFNSDQKAIEMTLVINKNNTYSFKSVFKLNESINTVAEHKGKISISANSYKISPDDGQKPAIYSYEIVNGKLSVDGGRPLIKIK